MKAGILPELLGALAIGYVGVLAIVFAFQSRLVYFPEIGREIAATPQAYGLAFDTVEIVTEDGERLHGWWVPAARPRGAVLFFHGNAGNISHRIDYLRMFHRLGYSTLIADYRGYGRSSGAPSEEGTYRDAVAAWRHLTVERGVKPHDIVLFGESLGAAVASWLAARASRPPARLPPGAGEGGSERPRALVLASAFTSVTDLGAEMYWFIPVRLISRFRYDNLAHLAAIDVPVLVAHSRNDEIVPFSHGQRLFAAVRGPRQFLEMRGGHNDAFVFAREEWVHAVAEFFERHAAQDLAGG